LYNLKYYIEREGISLNSERGVRMAKNASIYNLLISCPSDVQGEIKVINEVVDEFNRTKGDLYNVFIMTRHWSKDSYPQTGGKPQELLNKQFVLDCDAVVGVFWTRFGTPTDEYDSGTEEEIEELIKSNKQVFLYFSQRKVDISEVEYDQYQKVEKFKERFKERGLYDTFKNKSDFRNKLSAALDKYFKAVFVTGSQTKITRQSSLSIKCQESEVSNEKLVFYNMNYQEFLLETKEQLISAFKEIEEYPHIELNDQGTVDIPIILGERISFSKNEKDLVVNFAQENNLEYDQSNFFNLGNLYRMRHVMGGWTIKGSQQEKNKYNNIQNLISGIERFNQWIKYFRQLESKHFLTIFLSNNGTQPDEDIDVKLFIKKGHFCKKEDIPVPGDDILPMYEDIINTLYKPKKSIHIKEYSDYPESAPKFDYSMFNMSYEDEVEENKENYFETLNNLFIYDHDTENGYDVVCYRHSYIKQNTNVHFPHNLVFNSRPDSIAYEITSKNSAEIIKGELILE